MPRFTQDIIRPKVAIVYCAQGSQHADHVIAVVIGHNIIYRSWAAKVSYMKVNRDSLGTLRNTDLLSSIVQSSYRPPHASMNTILTITATLFTLGGSVIMHLVGVVYS